MSSAASRVPGMACGSAQRSLASTPCAASPAPSPTDGPAVLPGYAELTIPQLRGKLRHLGVDDLLLVDVVRRGTGAVRIVFHGEAPGVGPGASAGHLRIHVVCAGKVPAVDLGGETVDRMSQVRVVVEALGGRITGDHPGEGIEVLLPRR